MKRIITYGTFDLFHYGHYNLLYRAKSLGDYLVVGISSDEFCKDKGKVTILSLQKRMEIVSNLRFVDFVIVEDSMAQKIHDIKKYGINTFVLGSDYDGIFQKMPEYDILIDYEDYTNMLNTDNKVCLCTLRNTFVAGKELSKNYSTIRSISELANEKLISMCPNKRNGKFQKMCFENGILFDNIVSVNDSILSKELVKNNLALSFVNKEFYKEEIVSGEIREIKVVEELFDDNVYVVYKKSKNNDSINKFITTLKKQYKEEL